LLKGTASAVPQQLHVWEQLQPLRSRFSLEWPTFLTPFERDANGEPTLRCRSERSEESPEVRSIQRNRNKPNDLSAKNKPSKSADQFPSNFYNRSRDKKDAPVVQSGAPERRKYKIKVFLLKTLNK
jgi:hypothetical protein